MAEALEINSSNQKALSESLEINSLNRKTLAEALEAKSAAFTPFKLRNLELQNRIVMAPMGQYKAENGVVNDWHFQHYSSRAIGGLGLIITEMTAISENGRITKGCAGIYNENQTIAWKRIVSFIHQNTQTKIGIQIGHSGRKGNSKIPWEEQFQGEKCELLSASAIPFNENLNPETSGPKEMNLEDMRLVKSQFVKAAKNANEAGFDMIELQAHHGFLLASFCLH